MDRQRKRQARSLVRWIEFAGGKQAATGNILSPRQVYMRTGHSARTHIGRSSLGVRFAEVPAAGLLEITARNCRLAAAARVARTDPGRSTPDSPDAGECDRRLADR